MKPTDLELRLQAARDRLEADRRAEDDAIRALRNADRAAARRQRRRDAALIVAAAVIALAWALYFLLHGTSPWWP